MNSLYERIDKLVESKVLSKFELVMIYAFLDKTGDVVSACTELLKYSEAGPQSSVIADGISMDKHFEVSSSLRHKLMEAF